jgi:2-succinyl-5-enolpyruvyl-6-hydroxy-3-cyclohexene-1-carboxylate synthase
VNPSTALARVLVGALADLGVRHAVLCPGSRSAPLAYALAAADELPDGAGRLRLHVRIDERAAGFVALGLAKESGVPALVVTTSGTAAANLHPAVLEAAHAGVPLLVVTADRPHELRGTGANQTTDQVKLFGTAVRLFAEIPAPGAGAGQAAGWRNLASRAVAAARGVPSGVPGPVHLDVAFREPLVPDGGSGNEPAWPDPLDGDAGLTTVDTAPAAEPVRLQPGPRTVVVAGDGAGPAALRLAIHSCWPLLAEPSSGARSVPAIGPYRLLLEHPRLGARVQRVVVFGRPTLSRPVAALLGRDDVEVIVASARPDWPDAARRASRVVQAVAAKAPTQPDAWWQVWQQAGAAAAAQVDEVLDGEAAAGRLRGPLVAREVAAALRSGDALVAGASATIRDLDLAAHPCRVGAPPVVLANRGLGGIDGTVSTASGVAHARAAHARSGDTPVRALVGDLTFLHDAGGLLVGPTEQRPHLQVVVADNGGGGIFELLEPGALAAAGPNARAVFERLFATPHGADLAALCEAYRVGYRAPGGLDELRDALAGAEPGTGVVHVRTHRGGARELAARIGAAVQAALSGSTVG